MFPPILTAVPAIVIQRSRSGINGEISFHHLNFNHHGDMAGDIGRADGYKILLQEPTTTKEAALIAEALVRLGCTGIDAAYIKQQLRSTPRPSATTPTKFNTGLNGLTTNGIVDVYYAEVA